MPTWRQLPLDLRRNSSIAWVTPIGVPTRRHLEANTHKERLARDHCIDIGNGIGLHELGALIQLCKRDICRAD